MSVLHLAVAILGLTGLIAAAAYVVLANVAVIVWRLHREGDGAGGTPAVSVLKPLCGAEPGLYDHLRSFCEQDHTEFEILFGLADEQDPARRVVERLIGEFPHLPLRLVVDPRMHGTNRKVSNLLNMLEHASHEVIVMSDSDASVGRNYLTAVTSPLRDSAVGLVTCLYCGIPTGGIWSRLGAMYINEWYVPSILFAWLFGHRGYVSGQTLCLRRGTLDAIGGLGIVADQLAEDYRLGERVREQNLRIVLSPYLLQGEHHEPDMGSMTRHELRWMRTIRILRPRSFMGIFVTFSLPLAFLGIALAFRNPALSLAAWTLFGTVVISRMVLHFAHRVRSKRAFWCDFWLLPLRDLLLCWVWCRSFFGSRVDWRGNEFDVDADGVMRPLS